MQGYKLKIHKSNALEWLFILLICRYTIVVYMQQAIFYKIPIVGKMIVPVIIVAVIIASFSSNTMRRIKQTDILLYILSVLFVLSSKIFYSENNIYLNENLLDLIFLTIPCAFIGLLIDTEKIWKLLFPVACCSIIATILYKFYFINLGRTVSYNSDSAYYILFPILYSLTVALNEKKIVAAIMALFGIMFCLFMGTRGPILCLGVYCISYLVFAIGNWKKQGLILVSGGTVIAVLYLTGIWKAILEKSFSFAKSMGLSTRFYDYIINADLLVDSGRSNLHDEIFTALNKNPIVGLGLFGDRVVLNGSYVHNILIEFLCDFGYLIGAVLIMMITVLIIKALSARSVTIQQKCFLLMLLSASLVKLMVSGSYLIEQLFFVLLGYCIQIIRQERKNKEIISHNFILSEQNKRGEDVR